MSDIFRPFNNKQNVFEVVTPDRTYYIQAESEPEMMDWIKAFKHVIRSIKGRSTVVSNNLDVFITKFVTNFQSDTETQHTASYSTTYNIRDWN